MGAHTKKTQKSKCTGESEIKLAVLAVIFFFLDTEDGKEDENEQKSNENGTVAHISKRSERLMDSWWIQSSAQMSSRNRTLGMCNLWLKLLLMLTEH